MEQECLHAASARFPVALALGLAAQFRNPELLAVLRCQCEAHVEGPQRALALPRGYEGFGSPSQGDGDQESVFGGPTKLQSLPVLLDSVFTMTQLGIGEKGCASNTNDK
jgi:hypothetical protein